MPASMPADVSRETSEGRYGLSPAVLDRLKLFASEMCRWNARINLVARSDVPRLWSRHFEDSLQLLPLLPSRADNAVDLGSGGGFPGLVLAIASGIRFTLIESDARKCAFLREAARLTDAPVEILNDRIERIAPCAAHLVTARALAPLARLLPLVSRHLAPGGTCLLLKGGGLDGELTDAAADWHMDVMRTPSRTGPDGTILRICRLRRA